jgi:hypothetical protein
VPDAAARRGPARAALNARRTPKRAITDPPVSGYARHEARALTGN